MKIRAVLMDMDGTLLGKSQVAIPTPNMRAVQKAIDMGVHVIPCTGRVYGMLPPQLLTQEGIRYFVTSHGARAIDAKERRTVYEDVIPPRESSALMAYLEGKGLYNEVAALGTLYMEKAVVSPLNYDLVPEHHAWYMRDECYTAVDKPSEFFARENIGIEKMNIYNIPEALQQEVYDFVTESGMIDHTRPGVGKDLEFAHKGLNKLLAVEAILKEIGVSYEETLAIGDSSSDLAIIRACGAGVAMGNAPDNIKEAANYVTALNTEKGLAKAFEHFIF